jgi:hypothetical protein
MPEKHVLRNVAGSAVLWLFFLIFLLVGLGGFSLMFVLPVYRMMAARNWLPTECTILSSSVGQHSGGKGGSTYSVDVEYRYDYEGRTYTSKRYDAGPMGSSSGRDSKAVIVARYPAGSRSTCYVDPRQPEVAILNRGWPVDIFYGCIPLVFAVVGATGMSFAFRAGRRAKEAARLLEANPGKFWMVRKDWADGRVKSTERAGLLLMWIMAVPFSVAGTLMLVYLPGEIAKGGSKALYLFIIAFPLAGLGLLIAAVWMTMRWHKFGDSVFEMLTTPGAVGGSLAGTIRLGRPAQELGETLLKLSCVNRITTGSGKNSQTSETVLWDDEERLQHSADGHLPVLFAIPADARETDTSNSNNSIIWRLEARSKMPGIGYFEQFEVPVFRVALTPEQERLAETARERECLEVEQYQRPSDSRIQVSQLADGAAEFYFPAARNVGPAVGLTIFLAIWSGIVWALIRYHVPAFFVGCFLLAEVGIAAGTFCVWFRSMRVIAGPDGLTIINQWLAVRTEKRISAAETRGLVVKPGMTAGRTVYHDIKAVRADGKEFGVGPSIPNKQEADHLALQIERCIGKAATVERSLHSESETVS